jgi:hypothetical protein
MSDFLNQQQIHEVNVRMNGTPTLASMRGSAEVVPKHLPEVFSAQLAKLITRNEELLFQVQLIQNALELGYPELALKQCRKAMGR